MNSGEYAQQLTGAGLSIIPIRLDGSKAPTVPWTDYQHRMPTPGEIQAWWGNGARAGIAAVAGEVSGGLEIIDFDVPDLAKPWAELVREAGGNELLPRLPVVRTPSGGWHIFYRSAAAQGNQKLAQRIGPEGRPVTTIETRGRGGYAILPGSPAECHPSGKTYQLKQGDLTAIPIITPEERRLLLDSARAFDELPKQPKKMIDGGLGGTKGNRPGDEFNRAIGWPDILEKHGWKRVFTHGDVNYWRRPGKDGPGISATTNHGGSDLFYVFSSNASPFEPDTSFSKFAVYAILNHGGDFQAGARELAKQGFGKAEPEETQPVTTDQAGPIQWHRTDTGQADLFASLHAECVKYDHGRKRWLLFQKHYWQDDSDGEVIRLAQQTAQHRYQLASEIQDLAERQRESTFAIASETRSKIEAMLVLARCDRGLADAGASWNKDLFTLCAGNGVVLLDSGTLRPGYPADRITLHTSIPFDPSAKCPRWDQFLAEIFRDNPELPDFIRRAVGYSITGDTSEQCLFLLYGKGANGKSKFLGALRETLGDYAYNTPFSTIELSDRSSIPNDLAALVDRRFVTASETNPSARLNEARIKALTGGDAITARFLHCEFFTFRPVAKFWLSVNHKPRVSDDSYGFWRRVRLIPFTREFRGPEDDQHLEEKLRAELPGILAWAIRGSIEWRRDGLNSPACVTTATEQYRIESDPLAEFVEERCVQAAAVSVPARELYRAYTKWAEDRGMKESERLSNTAFGTRMSQRFEKQHAKQGNLYAGIGLSG